MLLEELLVLEEQLFRNVANKGDKGPLWALAQVGTVQVLDQERPWQSILCFDKEKQFRCYYQLLNADLDGEIVLDNCNGQIKCAQLKISDLCHRAIPLVAVREPSRQVPIWIS